MKYKIGYQKPPKTTQFKTGISGNARGRPKGSLNLGTDLAAELGKSVLVKEGNRSRLVSKQRALIKTLMQNALKGEVRSAAALLSLYARVITEPPESEPVTDEERTILRRFLPRLLKSLQMKEG